MPSRSARPTARRSKALIHRYFGDENFERRLLTGEGSTSHKLKLLTNLHRAVIAAPLGSQDKQACAVKVARMQANFLGQSKFFARSTSRT